ncbi:acetate--CoA ligase family protein [Tropicimonas sp. TH_r6]|uniref:acetate--CoA ligase family protein n=1 Tax=Tropicimonas sp. TH_r6 TaxID=3082085 RepID=UPI0029552870|nr:acetate--CoA ligase family protein [Tropicimonas sp. TH_r6]MDV7143108.1 acetate--CoA ligase family protein [Tropicimonas sp. TH_r6]
MTRDLSRLLRPRSIAVLGSVWAQNVVAQCEKMGFDGQIWPVHPSHPEIGGRRAFRALSDLPTAPDVTFLGINRDATINVVEALKEMGAGGAVCFASGWREVGAGDLQAKLVEAAGEMPIFGPNCYGMINYLDGAIVWPDQHGGRRVKRGVAVLSQSSNIAINITMQARGLPVAYVACLGNAAQVGMAELAKALVADERVTALGIYAEGIDDPVALARLAQDMRAGGKGVVMVKAGKTAAGASAAASHTAALAGTAAASSAYLRQCGIAEVSTLAEMIETLNVYHTHGPLNGPRFCSLSCSGGEATLVADLTERSVLDFPPPSVAQEARLSELLGPRVPIANPLDYNTYIWGDSETTEAVFTTMLEGYDAGIFVIDPPRPDRCDPASFMHSLAAAEAAARSTGKPAFPVATLPENFDEALAISLIDRGIAPLSGLETALTALAAATTPTGRSNWLPWAVGQDTPTRLLSEAEAKSDLKAVGIPVPRGVTGASLEYLSEAADTLSPPFALKALGMAHKTEAGGVRLGVTSLSDQAPMTGAQGYLLEEMATGGVAELLVGLRRDPVYGATLTLGLGGITAELLADTVTLVLPVDAAEIRAALERLRLAPLLEGYRGQPVADTGAAVDAVLRLQSLMATRPCYREIEINPLILRERGAVAVDALIRKDME